MDPSAFSLAARELRSYLGPGLGLALRQVTIGPPSAAAREQESSQGNAQDLLNMFFFRVEYDGYPADAGSADPVYARLYCLFTGFSLADTGSNGLSAGEKDLRVVGAVMQLLHQRPSIEIQDSTGAEVARLQVVPSPLSVDDINHIWATQGELPYRLSVAYELALLPVPVATRVDRSPRVGSLGMQVGTVSSPEPSSPLGFAVPPVQVDVSDPAWAPALRLVDDEGVFQHALTFAAGHGPTQVRVAVAGDPGASVNLRWERWDSENGWRAAELVAQSLIIKTGVLDPNAPDASCFALIAAPDPRSGQLQLTATRLWTRADGALILRRSNPVLLTIGAEAVP